MKNKIYPTLLAIASLICCITTARATMIGDTITISLQSPLGTSSFTTSIVVQAGPGDQVNLGGFLVIDPEATTINVYNLSAGVIFPDTGVFNGLVVTGINDSITNFFISTTLVGWNDSRLTFDEHSFSANFSGLTFPQPPSPGPGGFYEFENIAWCIDTTGRPHNSPDSGSPAVLLAGGILGLSVTRHVARKR